MWDTQVTILSNNNKSSTEQLHVVSQLYCSALPVAYSLHSPLQWEAFARFILEAAYEATLSAAVLNYRRTGKSKVTLGGGAFGNKKRWIMDAMKRAITLYREYDLDIVIVSYGKSDAHEQQLIAELS